MGFQEITFLEGAFSIRTYHEGTRFLLPASTQAVSYQALQIGGQWKIHGEHGRMMAMGSVSFYHHKEKSCIQCFGLRSAKLL